jgi:DNA polymerase-1
VTWSNKPAVDGYTETLFGRRRPFPELKSSNRVAREAAERAALNAPMQGTAADIIKRAMIAIGAPVERSRRCRPECCCKCTTS